MMKNMNNRSANPITEIENHFEQLFDFFRSTILKREEYYIALYLLFVYDRRVDLRVTVYNDNSDFQLTSVELNCDFLSLDIEQKRNLNDAFKPIFNKFGHQNLKIALEIISEIDRTVLKENFSEIFDRLLYRLSKSQSRFSGEFILPEELSRFMCSLVELPVNAKVYNPFAGLASFGVFLEGGQVYIGQEINLTTWAIGTLRILASDNSNNSHFIHGDSIQEWIGNQKFDLIISNPPFGLRLQHQYDSRFGPVRSVEHFLIENGLDALNFNGKMILCVSQGFLSKIGSEQNLRHFLIDNDLLEMVVSLPGGLLTNTGITTSILVVSKNKENKGKVKFVDAKDYVEISSSKELKLNNIALIEAIKSSSEFEGIKYVSNEIIASNNYNLSVFPYFLNAISDLKSNEEIVKLKEIANLFRGQRIQEGQVGKFIRVRDLKDNKIDFQLDIDSVEEIELPRATQRIDESCLILTTRWRSLKPTYFSYTGTPIYISPDLLVLKLDESKILLSYLVNELHADYVSKQIEAYRIGAVIPLIRKEDLLDVQIKVPILIEQQKSIMSAVSIAISEEKKRELILFNKIHGLEDEILEQNKYLRHSLAGPTSNLNGSLMNIKSIINNRLIAEIPNLMSYKVSEKHELNFGQYLDILEKNIITISDAVSNKLKVETDLESAVLKPIELISFLQNFEKEFKDRDDINYELEFDYDEITFTDDENGSAKIFILANENLLLDLLNNLINNAITHAFIDKEKHRIEIYLFKSSLFSSDGYNPISKDAVQILFSNTGIGFPEDFHFNDFTRKGSKAGLNAGNGFGGWYIQQIINKLGGDFDIIDEQGPEGLGDTDLATSFEINLPIIENEENEEI
jgi:type I restriction enzyme M protein